MSWVICLDSMLLFGSSRVRRPVTSRPRPRAGHVGARIGRARERANNMRAQVAVRMRHPRRGREGASIYEVEIGRVRPRSRRATRSLPFRRRTRSPIVEICEPFSRAKLRRAFRGRTSRIRPLTGRTSVMVALGFTQPNAVA